MLDSIQGLHIEPTNMCTLKCPKCARTDFINQYPKAWKNVNLNLNNLKRFLDIDLSNKRLYLCGNYGDAIYYDQLFEMVEYFKLAGAHIVISTNGSYKSKSWWEELTSFLTPQDAVIFGIDGTPDNFTNYRINADWSSVQVGIETVAQSQAQAIWQYIPFKYNENDIEAVKKLASELGIDEFIVFPSYRWDGEDDPLKPSVNVDDKTVSRLTWEGSNSVNPSCKQSHREHYISANGYYMPCCYVGDHRFYYKSEFFKNQDLYDISKTTLSQILTSTSSINFYNSIEDAKINYCTFNCPKL